MIGESTALRQVAFLGWLGPRGLGTVIFGLIAIGAAARRPAERSLVAKVVTVTVGLSLLAARRDQPRLVSWVDPVARQSRDGKPAPTAAPDEQIPRNNDFLSV